MKNTIQKKAVSILMALIFPAAVICALLSAVFPNLPVIAEASDLSDSPVNEVSFPNGKIIIDSADISLNFYFLNGNLMLQWEEIDGADLYIIKLDGETIGEQWTACPRDISSAAGKGGIRVLSVSTFSNGKLVKEVFCTFRCFTTLKTPDNPYVSENNLCWNEVPNATGYYISVNGNRVAAVRSTSFSLDGLLIDGESYSIGVRAFNDSSDAAYYHLSEENFFSYTKPLVLAKPENVFLAKINSRLILSFPPVLRATSYLATIGRIVNGKVSAVTEFELSDSFADITEKSGDGLFLIEVRSVYKTFQSEPARIVFYISNGLLSISENENV